MFLKNLIILIGLTLIMNADDFTQAVKDYQAGNHIKALNTFYVLAKKGDTKAQYNVGILYTIGAGVKTDVIQAIHWYEEAAKQNNGEAAYNLAQLYYNKGLLGEVNAFKKAKYWYEKAIDLNIKEASNNLATLYMNGEGVPKNEKKAFELLEKSAQLGNSIAQVNVGVFFAWGKDTPHDKLKAYANFKLALKQGQSEASPYLDKLCKESAWVCKN